MATITKRDLVVHVSEQTGYTQQQVLLILQTLIDTISSNLGRGDEVVLRNFGTFEIRETRPKIGRNPNRPNSEVVIPTRSVVKFKTGKELKEKVLKLSQPEPAKKSKTTKAAKKSKKVSA